MRGSHWGCSMEGFNVTYQGLGGGQEGKQGLVWRGKSQGTPRDGANQQSTPISSHPHQGEGQVQPHQSTNSRSNALDGASQIQPCEDCMNPQTPSTTSTSHPLSRPTEPLPRSVPGEGTVV